MSLYDEQLSSIVPEVAQEIFTKTPGKLFSAAYLRWFTPEEEERGRRKYIFMNQCWDR